MVKKNVRAVDFAGVTFNQYQLEYTYMENGKELRGLMDFHPQYDEYPILLVSETGENLLLDKSKVDFSKYPDFQWAEKTYQKLRQDIKKLDSLPEQEGTVWRLFQKQGGFLALVENGNIDSAMKSLNGKRTTPKPKIKDIALDDASRERYMEEKAGGMSALGLPFISVNSDVNSGYDTVLVHELTHNACSTISSFDNDPLFRAVIEAERNNGTSDILTALDKQMEYSININHHYTQQNIYQELLARLHEERLKNPAEFKKQLPVIDAFFEHCLYPTLSASIAGHSHTEQILLHAYQTPEIKQQLADSYKRSHDRFKQKEKLESVVHDLLWPCNEYGYRVLSEKKAQANPAYHQACQDRDTYVQKSQPALRAENKMLISMMKSIHTAAKSMTLTDKKSLSAWLERDQELTAHIMHLNEVRRSHTNTKPNLEQKLKENAEQQWLQENEENIKKQYTSLKRKNHVKETWGKTYPKIYEVATNIKSK